MTVAPRTLLNALKIIAVAGLAIHAFVIVILVLLGIFSFDMFKRVEVWIALWGAFSMGLPLYGILFIGLKVRENVREILGSVATRPAL